MNKLKNDYKLMLSTNLKELIKQKGVTITFVAKNTGVPLQTIHGWLQGNSPRNIIQIKKLAIFFNKSLDYICFGENSSKLNSTNQSEVRQYKITIIEL